MEIAELLKELCDTPGASGFEGQIARHAAELMEPYVDETWIDNMGNAIGVRRCGRENADKLLFDAHIDEVGFIVTGEDNGFLRFAGLGGLDARTLPSSAVEILSEPPRLGVVCTMPPHVLKQEEKAEFQKIEALLIDAGLTQEEAEAEIPPGTPGVMCGGAYLMHGNHICGKALDDRAGFAAILRALELLDGAKLDVDLYVMASVQEETGARGAAPGVYAIAPDWCVVIDADHAKTPDAKPSETVEETGGGVIISRGPNMNTRVTEEIIKIANGNGVRHHINAVPGDSGTNARAIQISRGGVATALLGIPLKYMHSGRELVSLGDVEDAAQLLCAAAKGLRGGLCE